MSDYTPPFHITDEITNLVAAISEQIGRITVLSHGNLNPPPSEGESDQNHPFLSGH